MKIDDTDDIVNKDKEIIEKEFIEWKARGFPKARLSVARKSVNDLGAALLQQIEKLLITDS